MRELWRRLRALLWRALLRRTTEESGQLRRIEVEGFPGDRLRGVEEHSAYGFEARPLPGADVLMLSLGGSRGHAVAASVADRRHRPSDLEEGEVALYTDEGVGVRLRRGRVVEIRGAELDLASDEPATGQANVQAPTVVVQGDVSLELRSLAAITINAPLVEIQGQDVRVGNGGSVTVDGGGGAVVDGVTVATHVHGGVSSGSNQSGPPE